MRKNKFLITYFVSIFLLIVSCDEAIDYYYGTPMQPIFMGDDQYERKLNIFGIIQPDQKSFIHVLQTTPTKGDTITNLYIENANVEVAEYDTIGQILKSNFLFSYPDSGSISMIPQYSCKNIKPQAHKKYTFNCTFGTFPVVYAETVVPEVPQLVANSLQVSTKRVSFKISRDTLAYMYDVYLISDNNFYSKRIVASDSSELSVELNPSNSSNWKILKIFAYDKNLALYFSTSSNSFYSFNTYRPPITTLTGGFGCIGSINCNFFELVISN